MSDQLELGSELLINDLSIWRHVHPNYNKKGRITQKAFKPRPKDEGLLSVSNSRIIKKIECFQIYKDVLCFPTDGLAEVSVGNIMNLPLKTYDNPLPHLEGKPDSQPFYDAHAVIDMRGLEEVTIDNHSAHLTHIANGNGIFPKSPS